LQLDSFLILKFEDYYFHIKHDLSVINDKIIIIMWYFI